jgi:hypothetical protein
VIKRCLVVVVRNRESMMHPHGRLVVEHRVDWRVVLHGDETSPGRIEERHLPVRGGEQVPAAEDLARIGSPVRIAAACGAFWR